MSGIIEYPLVTEKAMNDMDFDNKLQFVVDLNATKTDVSESVSEQYDVTVESVNTQVTMNGTKKAIVKLSEEDDAQDVASRIGVF
ncbi:LSU ribosomal protein L23Ae (L23p) [Halarchaeum acidiphilum MH1-52-1]|uniref:Large ribosomal subunit protein uL23 n=1 Tax=Halarchaeum acidiphilum MH1-52-1 TaxID=1261545 RepID=U2YVQ5_9EURY|nr:50S ribosomal protein L23 [Halarchaeum acidiphilum]GAD53115.1 LSU ribosomal protein L23Ae (L23p) [Halarchaeum acidiphilum MH1-52-1]